MRIAALASHGGSILQAVIDACETGELAAQVCLVVSNNSSAGAVARAEKHGIATAHLSNRTHPDPDALDSAIEQALLESGAQWVLLTGYMKKLGPRTLDPISKPHHQHSPRPFAQIRRSGLLRPEGARGGTGSR